MYKCLFLLLFCVSFPVCGTTIYKCASDNGVTVYSDAPCNDEGTSIEVTDSSAGMGGIDPGARESYNEFWDRRMRDWDIRNEKRRVWSHANALIKSHEREISALESERGSYSNPALVDRQIRWEEESKRRVRANALRASNIIERVYREPPQD